MSVPLPAAACAADLLAWAGHHLPTPEGRAEARLLLLHVLGQPAVWLFSHDREPVDPAAARRFGELVVRRATGEPVAYLTGHRGFWTLDLQVSPATLIPRPETERLVELALERLSADRPWRVADLGTGTGAIALSLASERPQARVIATDLSADALAIARMNAVANGIAHVEFRHGSWWTPLRGERFHLIASNPPYIADGDAHLNRGDLRFEPTTALASGTDGLDAIRELIGGAPGFLVPGGWLLLEHGWDQGAAIRALMTAAGFVDVATEKDLEQRDRVTLGRLGEVQDASR